MRPQRFPVLAVLCGTLVLNGLVAVGLAGLGSPGIENGGSRIASAGPLDPAQDDVEVTAPPLEFAGSIGAAFSDPPEILPSATPPARLVSLFRSDPLEEDLKSAVRPVETSNECLVAEICIEDYLWSFYERTPKVDTNKVTERIKATVT